MVNIASGLSRNKPELSIKFRSAVMGSQVCIYRLCSAGLKGDSANQNHDLALSIL